MINEKSLNKSSASPGKQEVPEWLFANITEASKNARKIYFLYLGFLFYCTFAAVGTPDRHIILNEKIHLQLLNLDVPIIGFFFMAPLFVIFLFVYLQLYLNRIKWLINLSTNYKPIEKGRLYPWMLNFPKDSENGLFKRLQIIIVKFSLWGLLPLNLGVFALWSAKTHDPLISYCVGIMPILGIFVVFFFWCSYEEVKNKSFNFIRENPGKIIFVLIITLFEFTLLFVIIPKARQGEYFTLDLKNEILISEPKFDYEKNYWGYFAGAHLEGASLVSAVLKRANLTDAHLQKADMTNANVEKADLTGVNLEGAYLWGANLKGSNLWKANLEGAFLLETNLVGTNLTEINLRGVVLREANLSKAFILAGDLSETDLRGANLSEAYFWGTNLSETDLRGTNVRGTDFSRANFSGAIIEGAINLTIEQLSNVKTLYRAILDPELEQQIKKRYPHLLVEPREEEGKDKD